MMLVCHEPSRGMQNGNPGQMADMTEFLRFYQLESNKPLVAVRFVQLRRSL
jgi:uncharacterized NAD-dependent epimerase/dehydratase family protein